MSPEVQPLGGGGNEPLSETRYFAHGADNSRIDLTFQINQFRQWMLQNIIRANLQAGNSILAALAGNGHIYRAGFPGRSFQAGNMGYYYNGGTSNETMLLPNGQSVRRYIPPMYIASNGNLTLQRLMNFAQRPDYARNGTDEARQEMADQAIRELDLIDTGRRTTDGRIIYRREGFRGNYIQRNDGGIEFGDANGGTHESGVVFRRQIYYAGAINGQHGGRWFYWETDVPRPPQLPPPQQQQQPLQLHQMIPKN